MDYQSDRFLFTSENNHFILYQIISVQRLQRFLHLLF